jgi:YidC/Oxa1 family membrane protein insertase
MPSLASIFTDIPNEIVVFFYDLVGNWGVAIILLTFTVRLAIVPLSIKQIRSMRALQALSPQLKQIQEKYKDDRQRQQQEMMKFYQENNINPLASCFPLLLQLPVFFALYAMLNGDKFKGEVVDSGNTSFLFIDNITEKPETTAIGLALVVLFIGTQLLAGLAMSVRGQLEGPQRFIVFGLPFAFAPFVFTFPTGLSIYWITTNVWTFGQQQVVQWLIPPPEAPTPEELEAAKPPPPPPRKKKKKGGRRR